MKRFVNVVVVIFVLGSSFFMVQGASSFKLNKYASTTSLQQDEIKTKITEDELPQAIKDTLAGAAYNEWTITSAYFLKGVSEYYQIELKKGDQTQTVNLDKQGKKVKSV
jgi:hypothetical protein